MSPRPINTPQLLLVVVTLGGGLLIKGHPVQAAVAVGCVLAATFSPVRLNLDRRGELRAVFFGSLALAAYVVQVMSGDAGVQAKLNAILGGLTYFFAAWLMLKLLIPRGFVAKNDLKAIFIRFWLGRFRDRSIQGGFYNPLYVFAIMWLMAASQGSARLHFAILVVMAALLVIYDSLGRQIPEFGSRATRLLTDGAFIRGAALALAFGTSVALFLPWAHKQVEKRFVDYLRGTSSGSAMERRTAIGEIGRLKLSEKVVMRVFTDSPAYLRDGVFTFYHRSMWLNPKMKPAAIKPTKESSAPRREYFYSLGSPKPGAVSSGMRVSCVAPKNRALPAPKGTTGLWVDEPSLKLLPGGVVLFPEKIDGYTCRLTFDESPRPEPLGEKERRDLLRLPPDFPKKIGRLAEEITKGKKTALAKIGALHSYLQSKLDYSLEQKEIKGSPLVHFLFRSNAGHCEYFATSMALMLRHLGIPSRYVTGYIMKEHNDVGGYWVVRERDAHSWLEAHVPGAGWVMLDPTPAAGTTHPPRSKLGEFMTQWLDLIGHRWHAWRFANQDKTFFEILKDLYTAHPVVGMALAAALLIILLYRLASILRGEVLLRRTTAKGTEPERAETAVTQHSRHIRELGAAYSRYEERLAVRTGPRLASETPVEFSARARKGPITEDEAEHLSEVVHEYCVLRYSPGALSEGSLKDFTRLVDRGPEP